MTMPKKLPILSPSIHTFEIVGEYSDYESKSHLFESIKKSDERGKILSGTLQRNA